MSWTILLFSRTVHTYFDPTPQELREGGGGVWPGKKSLNGCNNRMGVQVPVTESPDMHCFGLSLSLS
jgi:hypothetical protein